MKYEIDMLLLAAFFTVISGIGVYLQGVREGKLKKSGWDFFTEIVTAFIGGALAFYFAQSQKVEESLMIFCVIAASNNGRDIIISSKDKLLSIWSTLIEFIKYKSNGSK